LSTFLFDEKKQKFPAKNRLLAPGKAKDTQALACVSWGFVWN
jgi:hypothetical protein